jgi:hypothetical protein
MSVSLLTIICITQTPHDLSQKGVTMVSSKEHAKVVQLGFENLSAAEEALAALTTISAAPGLVTRRAAICATV